MVCLAVCVLALAGCNEDEANSIKEDPYAGGQLEEVMGKRTRAIERKLRQVEQLPHEESQKILPIDVEDDLTDY